jgi:cytochrome b
MTTLDDITHAAATDQRRIWDLPVRIFHWTLAAAIIAAFATNRLGVSYFKYHVWCGYAVIVLVLFRIAWGFVGTRHALFRNFVRGPAATARYALLVLGGRKPHYAGHNPLGAWMVLLLLIAVGLQAALGLFGNDDIFNVGPLAGYVSKETSLQLTSLHRRLFYVIMAAIALHVAAVIAHHVFAGEKLVQAMITGRKPKEALAESDAIASSRSWLAALVTAAVTALLALVVSHAPAVLDDGVF